MKNEIAVKAGNDLQVFSKPGLMGVASNLSSSDIQLPSLMLMQANSTFVEMYDGINSGDFVHSITMETWGKKDKEPVELIFFDMFKTQIVSDVTDTKKWIETNSWTEDMELAPYEEIIGDRTVRREKCFNYACFRALDIREFKHPVDGSIQYNASPIIVKFKGGSLKNGKRLNQVFNDYAQCGAPSWATTFMLSAQFEENDKGKYWVYNFKQGTQSLREQQIAAESLCESMQKAKASNGIEVIDSDEKSVDVTPKKTSVKNYAEGIV